ncbi:MAG: hypothetical protein NC338_00675 [Firmicutes bacterium]|nr:hypothetical protein [Bacillota bacterium]MCM1400487.1 hypothetical protein [Bacteroides sp.]MCM1476885.1 hypothetical protein [Bacteroides sp.]
MNKYALILTLAAICASLTMGCSKTASEKTGDNNADSLSEAFNNIEHSQLMAWRAMQGMPIYGDDIDSIVAYFKKADEWTAKNIVSVRTVADFDSLDARYVREFPYMEVYSMILENNASEITDQQMQQLQATAVSMGAKLDSASRALGLDPAETVPEALQFN